MLSQLSKGYGSWTAGYVDPYFGEKKAHDHELTFPEIDNEAHMHGITVGSRSGRSTALSWATTKRSREPTLDGIPLPKTYTTRKGALQLYVGPEDLEDEDDEEEEIEKREDGFALKPKYVEIKRPQGQELINLSLKLGTIDRLAMSVLQFGDNDYDHEHTSVSDAKNKAFLKFLHDVDEGIKATDIDTSVQPGGDLNTYLKDLKTSASHQSGNMRISKSRESLELQAILRGLDNNSNWPMSYSQDGASDRQSVGQFTRPVSRVSSRGASPGPPSTPRSAYQVLSAKKLCASIRSGSYLGRPSSRVSVNEDEVLEGETEGHLGPVTVAQRLWTPTESTDDFLLESRGSFHQGDDENVSDGGKRRGLKERSFLTNNSQLYKGRIARKGEGQRAGEVKVVSKGDGDSVGQRMVQIKEELGDISEHRKRVSESDLSSRSSTLSESEKDCWAERVSNTKHYNYHEEGPDDEIHESETSGIIDVEIDEKIVDKEAVEKVEVRLNSRPGSHKSSSSRFSSRPSSHKSVSSYCGSTSTHTPSIITLQSQNTPVSQEKLKSLYKRRNTFAYDPQKGLVRSYNNQRRKSDSSRGKNGDLNNLMDMNLSQNVPGSQGAKMYRNGPSGLHPGWTAYNNNYDWSVNTNINSNWPVADSTIQNMNDTDSYNQIQLDVEPTVDEVKADFAESNLQNDEEIVETAVIDQEEYVLDRIEECNAEVKQIEEQAEGQDAITDADDSDLDSTMDEELIKVILTGQSDTIMELKAQDESKTEESEPGIQELQDIEETEDIEVEEGADEVNNAQSCKDYGENTAIEDTDVAVEMSQSNLPDPLDEVELQVVGKGQVSPSNDGLETVRQEVQNETVDEENASDVRSYKSGRSGRSGRKSRTKKSKSGIGSEEGSREEIASANEYVLPTLESDQMSDAKDARSISAELDALGLGKKSSKGSSSSYPLLPPGKRPKPPPEKTKIPDHIAEALNRQTDASIEYLEQDLERMTALVGESLSGPTLEAVGEGLTEEELEIAKQILQQKLDEAKGKLDGKPAVTKGKGGKKPSAKSGKKGSKKGKEKETAEEKSPEELDREAIREKHEQEKMLREQEAAELQKKIAEKQQLLKEQNDLTSARSKELKEEMERLEREAEAIQRAEDEAREILADVRKKQREERETRRKADLERKKQEALDRREREKKEMEEKRRKEMEMMEKIADAEMRRRMREEEERRIDEEERLAQERYEAELIEAQRLEEEEEERLKEMERQAEEEAMQRLIDEREAAERERRRLREEEEALQEVENLRRLAMEDEHRKLEDERRRMQEAEDAKRNAEKQRLLELRRLEEEARMQMQEEIEKRRTDAMLRRDYNLESRAHVDKLRHNQGLTRAWTFSYFVHWPRETYESKQRRKLTRNDRPMGDWDPRKVKIKNPKPKQKVDNPPESGEAPPAGVP